MQKKKDAVSKDEWYRDDFGNPVINRKGEFSESVLELKKDHKDFQAWKSTVLYAIHCRYPEKIFATALLSAAEMRLIIETMYEQKDSSGLYPPDEIQIWRTSRAELDYIQLKVCLTGLRFGYDIVGRIPDARLYDAEVLWWLVFGHVCCKTNFARLLSPGMDKTAYIAEIQDQYRKRGIKRNFHRLMSDMVDARPGIIHPA